MPKYNPFPAIGLKDRTWPDQVLNKSPLWCSVDLRDGNQALVNPMSVDQKLDMFQMLCQIGFKEIEVGFPSASQIEFDFLRTLVEEKRIPKDVTVQVLCQARQHLVDKTFEALKGVKRAIFHLYSSTSPAHRKYTFQMSKAEVLELAIAGVEMVKKGAEAIPDTEVVLQYSPESFSQTEMDFALEVCNAVHLAWGTDKTVIFNLPATVEVSTPNVHADQIEWFSRKIPHRDKVIISLHTHNDRGTGIAAAELGLMAGAQRVEGTLFGNGERTGNLDVVTLALNFFTQGVDTGLDFFNLPKLVTQFEEQTGMSVPPRHPYAGDLVFTAFSGSHQDAIKKALEFRNAQKDPQFPWDVPYLPVDPKDLGRSYEAVIRFNSQSGKGGAAYLLKERYGLDLPKAFHPEVGTIMNKAADEKGKELSTEEIWNIFENSYLKTSFPINFIHFDGEIVETPSEKTILEADIQIKGQKKHIKAIGGGPLEAFAQALRAEGFDDFEITDFHENSVTQGENSRAAAFVQIKRRNGVSLWGCSIQESITQAGLGALVSALNRSYSQ